MGLVLVNCNAGTYRCADDPERIVHNEDQEEPEDQPENEATIEEELIHNLLQTENNMQRFLTNCERQSFRDEDQDMVSPTINWAEEVASRRKVQAAKRGEEIVTNVRDTDQEMGASEFAWEQSLRR